MSTKKPHRADDRRRNKDKSDGGVDEPEEGSALGMGRRIGNFFNDRRYMNGNGRRTS